MEEAADLEAAVKAEWSAFQAPSSQQVARLTAEMDRILGGPQGA